MWFDGEGMQHPGYTIENKSRPLGEPVLSNGLFWGDLGLGRYKLGPGQSSTFTIWRHEFTEPFRVGVWLSPEADNKTFSDRAYWSEIVSPKNWLKSATGKGWVGAPFHGGRACPALPERYRSALI
jgi:hypothetical protein